MEYFTLSNGLRIVCDYHNKAKVDYFGVAINAGSRDEDESHQGLAHFVEHTIFKGTTKRRACHIITRMEAVGGELNAFTSKEETNVYSIFPNGNLARAVELIADLLQNSIFPANELDKEREVVREEIDSYLDTPSEAVFDEFEDLFFKGSQLGHNILGNASNLISFTPEVCRNYIHTHYTPDRMVAFYRGNTPADKVVKLIEKYLGNIPSKTSSLHRITPANIPQFCEQKNIDSHQAHCVMGAAVPGIYSDERIALGLLTNILGGPGMNSRLNVSLRERRGLVYAVDASLSMMSDCGLFTVYFGCDPADAKHCRKLVNKELLKIATEPLSVRALNAAKQQYLGQLIVMSENSEQMVLNAARSTLFFGSVPNHDETRKKILSITPEQLLNAARYLHPASISSLTLT